jgi:hypothetical protein
LLKEFYVELSEILRAYAGGRWGFDSVELTVEELIVELRSRFLAGLDLVLLERVLKEADFVKFAKYVPSAIEAETAINGAFSIVDHTRPAAPRQEAESGVGA